MKDYQITITIKNNYLLSLMRIRRITTAVELADVTGAARSAIYDYLSLKRSPLLPNGDWSNNVIKIAEYFHVMPQSLFPPQHIHNVLESNKATKEISADEIDVYLSSDEAQTLALQHFDPAAKSKAIVGMHKAMDKLPPRYKRIIKSYYGIDGDKKTIHEIADEEKCGYQNILVIVSKSLARLRRPASAMLFKDDAIEGGLL